VLFVEDDEQLDKALEARGRCPTLEKIVIFDMEGLADFRDPMCLSLAQFLAAGCSYMEGRAGLWRELIDSRRPQDLAILATFGISLVLQKYALWQWGPSARKIQEPITGQFHLFYLEYPWYRVATAIFAAAIIGALWLFLRRGKYGIWIRAATQDRIMASAMGIPVPLVHTLVFAIGAGMAAASGVLFGPLGGVTQTMGFDFTLRAFIVVVVGGMGNLGGSILASIFVSLLEAYASLVVSPAQAVIASFVALILTLLFRPTGLFVPTPK